VLYARGMDLGGCLELTW